MAEMAEDNTFMQSQPQVWKMMWAFADSMALKCSVDLRIADIIHSHGCPVTIQQLAAGINSPSPNLNFLSRIMRFLVYKNIFTAKVDSKEIGVVFGLTPASKWLLQDGDHLTMAPLIKAQTHEILMSPWGYFSKCVEEGGNAFSKVHSSEIWDLASTNPDFNISLNAAMTCVANITITTILATYNGFDGLESLVDVGGGTGVQIREIVKHNTHIRGIFFDLPHVVATAPEFQGVEYIGGDMFVEIPSANAVIMKSILHDWTDDECVTILKNCHKAIGKNGKKVIVVEIVMNPEGGSSYEEVGLTMDLAMIAHTSGKERTEDEWRKILNDGGFPRCKVIQIPSLYSIIEAYPA